MAEIHNLKVVASSDVAGLTSGMTSVQNSLGKTAIAAQRTDTSLSKLGQGANTAGTLLKGAASNVASLGASLLSGGILTGITLIGVALFELGKSLISATKEQQKYNDVLQEAKSAYIKATLEVEKMRDAFDKAKSGVISKKEALNLYNNTIGKTIGQTNDLDIAERNFIANAENYIKYTLYKAAANAALAKAAEAAFNAEAAKTITAKRGIFEGYVSQEELKKRREAAALKDQVIFQKIYNDLIAKANAFGFVGVEQKEKEVKLIKKKTEAEKEYNQVVFKMSGRTPLSPDAPTLTIRPDLKIVPNKVEVVIDPAQQKAVLDAMNKFLFNEDLAEKISQTYSNIINDTIGSITDGIADALSGGKDVVPRLFDNIMKGIGGQLKELGQYLVKVGLMKEGIDKAIKALNISGVAAIAIGIGAQVLGAFLINSATKKANQTGFATGVRNFQPDGQVVTVGERGPENIFLPRGSTVQPNNELNAYGSGGFTLQPSIAYSGTDFRIFLNRVDQQMGRNN